jgi:phenylacetate-CoA ligase
MVGLDVLRGAYVRSPGWVRRSAAWPLSVLPVRLRYGRNYGRWRKLIETAEADVRFRTTALRRNRAEMLRHALRRSPYYGELLAPFAAAIEGSESAGVSDELWEQIPILTKSIVREQSERLVAADKGTLDLVSTSGSSGRPTSFYLDRDRSVAEYAFVNHAWSRAGYKEGDLRCVFRGVQIHRVEPSAMEFEPALGELRCSPFHLTDDNMATYLAEIRRRRIRFIHGYPSAISIFAAYLKRSGSGPLAEMAGIFPISETLLEGQRRLLREVFPNARILPFYGMSEKVAFAVEEQPGRYAFQSLYGFAELLDERGATVREEGQRGRIVGTGFLSRGMPLIRYDTEDEATLVEAPSPANGYRLVVRDLTSRWSQEFLVSKEGGLISISAINIHSHHYAAIREFQFSQQVPGAAVVRVVLSDKGDQRAAASFAAEILQKLGGVLTLDYEIVASLKMNQRGKRRFIDQHLDLRSFASADRIG